MLRPIIIYTMWYSEHTLSQLLIQHSCIDFLFACFFRTPGMSLVHIISGLCVHPKGGRPSEGVPLVYYEGCDQPRLKLDLFQLKGNAKTLLFRQRRSTTLHRLHSILPRCTIHKTCMGLELFHLTPITIFNYFSLKKITSSSCARFHSFVLFALCCLIPGTTPTHLHKNLRKSSRRMLRSTSVVHHET